MLTRNKILAAIKESTQKAQHNNKEYFLFGRIYVFIKDPVLPEISIKSILDKIESIVPMHMMEEIDEILKEAAVKIFWTTLFTRLLIL